MEDWESLAPAANNLVLAVFLRRVAFELAMHRPQPRTWATAFTRDLHALIDLTPDQDEEVREAARQMVDALGSEMLRNLPEDRG